MEKMGRIHMLNTWTLVPSTEDMNIMDSKWVFRTKLKPHGDLDKLKHALLSKALIKRKEWITWKYSVLLSKLALSVWS